MSTAGALALTLGFAPTASGQEPALRAADAPAAQLERVSGGDLGEGDFARYSQEVGGVPVAGASVTVVDVPGEAPEVLFDDSVPGLSAAGEPAIGRAAAVDAALGAIGDPAGGRVEAELVVDAAHGNQLAWQVSHTDFQPISDRLVTVSAATGSILDEVNLLRRATGSAQLFEPNAVVENDGYAGISDNGDADSIALTNLRFPVALRNLVNGQSCLKGRWAHAKFSPNKKSVCRDDLDWSSVKRQSNRFEALMAYYHATEIQRYIQTLDLDPINQHSQKIFANTFDDDNSFYSPSADHIQLGTGGVDDGEDGDVIVHEYGHAVQDAQNPTAFRNNNNQSNAMGEGFGDYLAAVHQIELVGHNAEWTPCIMEWDATSYDDQVTPPPGICLRRADDASTHAAQVTECGGQGSFHCVGQVWSSALLDLRITLGDDPGGDSKMDTLLLASHELLPESPSLTEAADAIMTADALLYGDANCAALAAEFNSRGFGSFIC